MESENIQSAFMIGAGNVAWRLSDALSKKGIRFLGVYNRSKNTGKRLAAWLHVPFFSDITKIPIHADIYFLCVSDQSIAAVSQLSPENAGITVHVSGSTPLQNIDEKHRRRGIFYPLQTFNKERNIDFSKIPVAIEATNESDKNALIELASSISETVVVLDEKQRQALHVAAVFASNFTNYMYAVAAQILQEEHLDFELLMPLILETARRAGESGDPFAVQTGPAARNDRITIQKHLNFLQNDENLRIIYKLLTEAIRNNA